VDTPSGANPFDTVQLNTTVENIGTRSGTKKVSIRVVDPSGSERVYESTQSLASGDRYVDTQTFSPSQTGEYRFFVETPEDATTGSFYIGANPSSFFEITSVNTPADEIQLGTSADVAVSVNNTGIRSGEQDITVTHVDSGVQVGSADDILLAAGESSTATVNVPTGGQFEDGANDIRVETGNTSWEATIDVTNESVIDCTDGSCRNTVGVRGEIVLEGAEFENPGGDVTTCTADEYDSSSTSCEEYEESLPNPTDIRLVVENETGQYEELLWGDRFGGDVNHPAAESLQLDDSTRVYNRTVILPPNTSVSLDATSYVCDRFEPYEFYDWDGEIYENVKPDGYDGVAGVECVDRGTPYLSTNSESNSQNVVARNDSDPVPGYGEANDIQMGIPEMLDGQIEETGPSSAVFDLGTDERVFLFELSYPNADPADAFDGSDPDYNDAVARYRVLNVVEEINPPAKFKVLSVRAPSRVDPGADVEFAATVANTGGYAAETEVRTEFVEGESQTLDFGTIGPNKTETMNFTLDTSGLTANKSHQWQVDALANTTRESSDRGTLFVGDPANSYLQIKRVEGPLAADADDSPQATVEIGNIGDDIATNEDLTLVVEDENGTEVSSVTRPIGSLAVGGTQTESFDLPSNRGTYTYYATTAESTSLNRTVFVGDSSVSVRDNDGINIGLQYYDPGAQIERDGGIRAMNVRLQNDGTVGDDRTVNLTIDDNAGTNVYAGEKTKRFGNGDLRSRAAVQNTSTFDFDIDPGYYTYEVTVKEDGTVEETVTGGIYLKDTSSGVSTADDSPVTVDSSAVSVDRE
jgi:hypothetical protein